MHTSSARLQNVFGFFTTVAFLVGLLTALSVVLYPTSATTARVHVDSAKVVKGRPQHYAAKSQEYAFLTLSLDADLTPLFNWNTKQVFTWISLTYGADPTLSATKRRKAHTDNEAIVWDAIITRKEAAKLHLNKVRAKYNLNDISGAWGKEGRNATLRVGWNVQPHVGALVGPVGAKKPAAKK
ncbi:signal peptidase 22kDa subunit [Geopyxis carbonaria]|nr:signal peptidase 22kDa subunit [Geopyxis carbonaria]